jgi:uncharacterized protein
MGLSFCSSPFKGEAGGGWAGVPQRKGMNVRAVLVSSDKELAARITVADTFFSRLKGLLGASSLPRGEGLWIIPCKAVHTFGMRFPIDLLFLDREQRVVSLISCLVPNRITAFYRSAVSVLELPAGSLDGLSPDIGEQVLFL